MIDAERPIRAASRARDLCLALARGFAAERALARLEAGEAAALGRRDLEIALGQAWATGRLELVRAALAALPAGAVERDAVLAAFRDAAARGADHAREES
jgi:hypothetical protein